MKKYMLAFLLLFTFSVLIYLLAGKTSADKTKAVTLLNFKNEENENESETVGMERGSPGYEKWFFERWHYPYGANIPMEKLQEIYRQIDNMPQESDLRGTDWENIGPFGSTDARNIVFSGRIRDIHIKGSSRLMVGSASGGLWKLVNNQAVLLSSPLQSPVAAAFDVNPADSNIILLGTGEPGVRGGIGLYRTTNGGLNWNGISMAGNTPNTFYTIRFNPQNPLVVHAAADKGYYRSTNGGTQWAHILTGTDVTDVVMNPRNPDTLYCGRKDDGSGNGGVYRSTNAGLNWVKQIAGQLPGTNVGRVSLAYCKNNADFIYALIASTGGTMLGVYNTQDNGDFWGAVSPPGDILGTGFGWYVGAIGVCPTNPNICLAGGIWLWRTTNYGQNWSEINYFNDTTAKIHSDIHEIAWDTTGNTVWIGHDGGISTSNDKGVTYNTTKNVFPITQYVYFDISASNPDVMFGGSRDNAFTGTTNGGANWKYIFNGPADGGGAAINPANPSEIFGTLGELGGSWRFGKFYSSNFGTTWNQINNGIDPSGGQYYPKIVADNNAPMDIFTNSDNHLYYSTNNGANWVKRNSSAFASGIGDFSVREYGSNQPVIYVCLASSTAGQRLKVQTSNGSFVERSTGLPDGLSVRGVTMHLNDSNTAYAYMNGFDGDKKVYKTTNQGLNWTNISGTLTDAPIGGLVVNPYLNNTLYAGTEMGFFKTTDGGTNWFRWNSGAPTSLLVTEMKSYIKNGKFYIIAATYGSSFWVREDPDTPVSVGSSNNEIPSRFELQQNYPNPFNPETNIKFSLPAAGEVQLLVFDAAGRQVSTLINTTMQAGRHEVTFNASGLASGVYFYKLKANGFNDIKKMILIK